MIFDDVLKERRSIRSFYDRPISDRDIERIIEAAILTPSPKNRQPWKFHKLGADEKERLLFDMRELDRAHPEGTVSGTIVALQSAPVLIAVYALSKSTSDILSIGAAMYGMCLKATDLDIGSLWVGDSDILNDLEEYKDLIGIIALGYPKGKPSAQKRHDWEVVTDLTKKSDDLPVEDVIPDAKLEEVPYVFVSYSHADSDLVRSDIVELKRHGIPLWYDKALLVGEKWDKQALKYIRDKDCRGVLWYVSYESLASDAVYEELKVVIEERKKRKLSIIPILIGGGTVSPLIARLRMEGKNDRADLYEKYFGKRDKVLFIPRSIMSRHTHHLGKVLKSISKSGVKENYSVYDCYYYEIVNGEAVITGYKGPSPCIEIPEKISGFPVTEIGDSAFSENTTIEKVIVKNTVKRLGAGVFRASTLVDIVLPDSIEEISTACFRDCLKLERIVLPSKITYLSEALFRGCANLREVIIPNDVVEMKEAVFNGCSSLEEVRLPDSLSVMTDGGFYGCSALRRLTIPETVQGVRNDSFDTSPCLERVRIGGFIFEKGKGRLVEDEE